MKKTPKVSVGMINPPEFLSLEEIEANKKFKKFGETSLAKYQEKVSQMTSNDLYEHCIAVGIRPNPERKYSVANLITLFKETSALVERYSTKRDKTPPMPQPAYASNSFLDRF